MKRNLKRGIALVLCFVLCFCFCVRGFGVVSYVEAATFDDFKNNIVYIGAGGGGAGGYIYGSAVPSYQPNGYNASDFGSSYSSTAMGSIVDLTAYLGGNAVYQAPSYYTPSDTQFMFNYFADSFSLYSPGTQNMLNQMTSGFLGDIANSSVIKYDATTPLEDGTMKLNKDSITKYSEMMSSVLNMDSSQYVSSDALQYNYYITETGDRAAIGINPISAATNFFCASKSQQSNPVTLFSSDFNSWDDLIWNFFTGGMVGVQVSPSAPYNGIISRSFDIYYTDSDHLNRCNAIVWDADHNQNIYAYFDPVENLIMDFSTTLYIGGRYYIMNSGASAGSWAFINAGGTFSPLNSLAPSAVLGYGNGVQKTYLDMTYNASASSGNNDKSIQNYYRFVLNNTPNGPVYTPLSIPEIRNIRLYTATEGTNAPRAYLNIDDDISIGDILLAIKNLVDNGNAHPTQPQIIKEVSVIIQQPEAYAEYTPGTEGNVQPGGAAVSDVEGAINYGDDTKVPVFYLPFTGSDEEKGPVAYLLDFVKPVAYFVHDIFLSLMESDTTGYTYAFIGVLTLGLVSGVVSKLLL